MKPKIDSFKSGAAAKDISISLSGQLRQRLLHVLQLTFCHGSPSDCFQSTDVVTVYLNKSASVWLTQEFCSRVGRGSTYSVEDRG